MMRQEFDFNLGKDFTYVTEHVYLMNVLLVFAFLAVALLIVYFLIAYNHVHKTSIVWNMFIGSLVVLLLVVFTVTLADGSVRNRVNEMNAPMEAFMKEQEGIWGIEGTSKDTKALCTLLKDYEDSVTYTYKDEEITIYIERVSEDKYKVKVSPK